jgi:O-antigen ligase
VSSTTIQSTLDRGAWLVFFGLVPILWASGVWLFIHSALSSSKKIGWVLFLIVCGIAIGFVLPLAGIRNRFLVLLAVLPLLAVVDIGLARSNRRFFFWLRACGFEVCTVFGCAAVTRLLQEAMNGRGHG